MSRRSLVLLLVVLLVVGALVAGFWLTRTAAGREGIVGLFEIFPSEDRLVLKPATFQDLPGWHGDAVEEALPAFLLSCQKIDSLPDGVPVSDKGSEIFAGRAGDWRPLCAEAARIPPGDREAVRRFFETRFQPWSARNHGNPLGLFTGYYEPLLHGSRKRHGRYTVPLYGRPPELVTVDLGRFRDDLRGRRIAGKVVEGSLIPFPDRREIDEGALAGRKLEIVWVDDPIGAFFLQVQGSGRVELAEGGEIRVGYAAQNGRPYTSIGKALIQSRALNPETVSLQTIRAWLEAHPDKIDQVLEKDASYVFFQEVKGEGPLGAEGVPLTPGRSLAVDLNYLPLGVPLWLSGGMPAPQEGEPDRKLHRLLIAQDTGGAIRGPVRGDLFWGFGPEAEAVAGRMKHRGKLWVLLPKGIRPV
ncbi:MAG TPA: MltA domain-containing protein [Thermoanaerobaculia bacterium]|nr:MltA domain-containing protein [Thermoanaerobaculia bacterium]